MQVVPIQPVPNQTLQVQLGGQACTIDIRETAFSLVMDVYVSGTLIIGGVICENLNRIVRSLYLGFLGDFMFDDTQGDTDPVYTGLGSQYQLMYLEVSDLPVDVG